METKNCFSLPIKLIDLHNYQKVRQNKRFSVDF